MTEPVTIRLPWPPTVNTYWRRVGNRTLISRKGRQYRKDVAATVAAERVGTLRGRLLVNILAVVPDRRQRDLDNLLKSSLDALEHAGVFEDDGQIDDLRVLRDGPRKPGWIEVRIEQLETRYDQAE